jgi:DNA-binding CsgD family transcriptional regulator
VLSFEDFVERSQRAATIAELRATFEGVMRNEGYENSFLGKMVDGRICESQWVNFPEGHFENYLAEGWQSIDPILAFTARARRPFLWDDQAALMQFEPAQIALLEECKRVGVHSLIVAPIHEPDGSCNIVGVSKRHGEPPDPARVNILQAFCLQTWCRHATLTGASLLSDAAEAIELTRRELEILTWIRDGKSNGDIAEILCVSVKTIEYHVGNLLRKLGATNRTTAVVIALQRQLIAL